jgi:hypothetical protein
MTGVITTKHLFSHALTILVEFGPRAYFRCLSRTLLSTSPVTFLDCISPEVIGTRR